MLQRADLVTTYRVGQWVFYRRNEKTIAEFLECLQRNFDVPLALLVLAPNSFAIWATEFDGVPRVGGAKVPQASGRAAFATPDFMLATRFYWR